MDVITAIGAVLLGLLLRLGVPFAITALLVWALKRLDARWQREAVREGAVMPINLSVPCWVMRDCPPEVREACPAYRHPEQPCWQVIRNGNGRVRECCLECEVFRTASLPMAA